MSTTITRTLAGLAVLALGALAASAQQQRAPAQPEWKRHTFADDRFEVEFAGPVKSEAVKLDAQSRKRVVRSMQHVQDGDDLLLIVGAQHNIDAVNFEGGARSSFATFKCKATQPEIELPLAGGRGREVKGAECINGRMRAEARYFEHGKWFYQVIAIFAADRGDDIARRFLGSFKIVGP